MSSLLCLLKTGDTLPGLSANGWVAETPLGATAEVGVNSSEEELCSLYHLWSGGRTGSDHSWHGWFDDVCQTARPELVAELLYVSGYLFEFDTLVAQSTEVQRHIIALENFATATDFRERGGEAAVHRVRSLIAREAAISAVGFEGLCDGLNAVFALECGHADVFTRVIEENQRARRQLLDARPGAPGFDPAALALAQDLVRCLVAAETARRAAQEILR